MAARAVSPAMRCLPFGAALEPVARSRLTQELLGPGVVQALGDGSAVTNGGDAFLTAEPFQDNADLVLDGMVLACGATDVADQLFGWHAGGWESITALCRREAIAESLPSPRRWAALMSGHCSK